MNRLFFSNVFLVFSQELLLNSDPGELLLDRIDYEERYKYLRGHSMQPELDGLVHELLVAQGENPVLIGIQL